MTTIPKQTRAQFLLNPVFILSLLLLGLNDHVFKYEYSNWLTGKLSDVAGMIVLPAVLAFIWPKDKAIKWHVITTGLFFLFWKSPFSQGLIDTINGLSAIQMSRVIDYSDLVALFVLPLSYCFLKRISHHQWIRKGFVALNPIYLLIPALFVLVATSVYRQVTYSPLSGNLLVDGTYLSLKMSEEEFLQAMHEHQIAVYEDSLRLKKAFQGDYFSPSDSIFWVGRNLYRVDELILKKDTIHDLQLMFFQGMDNQSSIIIEAMNVDEKQFEEKNKRQLQRYFSRQVKKRIHRALAE